MVRAKLDTFLEKKYYRLISLMGNLECQYFSFLSY